MDAGENNETHKNKIHHNKIVDWEKKMNAVKAKYVLTLIEYIVGACGRRLWANAN